MHKFQKRIKMRKKTACINVETGTEMFQCHHWLGLAKRRKGKGTLEMEMKALGSQKLQLRLLQITLQHAAVMS